MWILLGICIIAIIYGMYVADDLHFYLIPVGIILIGVIIGVLVDWNATHSTAVKQISVLEERKVEIVASLNPIVDKYLGYETDTIKGSRVSDLKVAVQLYPELKGNEFVMKQLDTLNSIESQITDLKLNAASLNAYRLWLFLGE